MALGLLLQGRAAANDGPWWQTTPPGQTLIELTPDLEAAKAGWEITPGPSLTVVADELTGRQVIRNQGTMNQRSVFRSRTPVRAPFEVETRVRIAQDVSNHDSITVTLEPDATAGAPAPVPLVRFYADTMPGAEPRLLRLEGSVAGSSCGLHWLRPSPELSPPVKDLWFRLRIVCDDDEILFYKDGYLAGTARSAAAVQGHINLVLAGHVHVAETTVRQLPPRPPGFHPAPLDHLANATAGEGAGALALRRNSLPPTGSRVVVHGIPFVFPAGAAGADHVDIARSHFALGNAVGGFDANVTWPAPSTPSTERLMLNVPPGPHRRLWLIAAFDERPYHVPALTARFFRPGYGPVADTLTQIPALRAAADPPPGAERLAVEGIDGTPLSLWLVPVDLDPMALRDVSGWLELTKRVYAYRNYPDPANYSWLQGGLPSGVRVFAMTIEDTALDLQTVGSRRGHAYVAPEQPVWALTVRNLRPETTTAHLELVVTDPYGTVWQTTRELALAPRAVTTVDIDIPTKVFGLHRVRTVLIAGPDRCVKEDTFVQLPADTRRATAANSRWGLWTWAGAHQTNANAEETAYLLRAAGTRVAPPVCLPQAPEMFPRPEIILREPIAWPAAGDPEKAAELAETIGQAAAKAMTAEPRTQYVAYFAEKAISEATTYGILPEYLGEGQALTAAEQETVRDYLLTATAASEGIRRLAPGARILLGWCEPAFTIPLLREKFPRDLFDGIGVDTPQFERLPEMPIRSVTPTRMWMLKDQMKRLGYEGVEVVHLESYFPSSHALALGLRGSADHIVRTAVLSLALGSTRLLNCFALEDCGDYWGNQHYGGSGIVGPMPDMNPKPAFAAYATMTRLLDLVAYDGYVPAGSHAVYCVRFRDTANARLIYCLWTLRGRRPATLLFDGAGSATRIDESGNAFDLPLTAGAASVTLSATPFWIVTGNPITRLEPGTPIYAEQPGPHTILLDPLDQAWRYDPGEYPAYATNHWDILRVPGPMRLDLVQAPARQSTAWRITLDEPEKERRLAAWYGVFVPPTPIAVPGKARALGLWVNGNANWGRIVYEINDANGELWRSIGTKNDWNCDDIHSWSSFNFDGWRFVQFPLPGHLPGDNYREADTVWWGADGDGVVDLPVQLTRVIIELRTHNVYVDDLVAEANRSVELAELVAVYDDELSKTDAPVRLQRETAAK